jgi:hypothetical protein
MKDILFTALLLACPLSMVAMGAFAWVATKIRRARGGETSTGAPTTEQTG